MLPWGYKYDTLGHTKVKCYSGLFCALVEYHPYGHKNYQLGAPDDELRSANKHFWRRCRGSNWLKILLNSLIILYSLITANLSGLTTVVFVLWWMQGSAWPVSTYLQTSILIRNALGETWDVATSHRRSRSAWRLIHHQNLQSRHIHQHHLHHQPWAWRHFVSFQLR